MIKVTIEQAKDLEYACNLVKMKLAKILAENEEDREATEELYYVFDRVMEPSNSAYRLYYRELAKRTSLKGE